MLFPSKYVFYYLIANRRRAFFWSIPLSALLQRQVERAQQLFHLLHKFCLVCCNSILREFVQARLSYKQHKTTTLQVYNNILVEHNEGFQQRFFHSLTKEMVLKVYPFPLVEGMHQATQLQINHIQVPPLVALIACKNYKDQHCVDTNCGSSQFFQVP